jgi:hypothetical protein
MSGIVSAIDELEIEDLNATSDAALIEDVVEQRRRIDQQEAQWLRRIAEIDRRRLWQADGSLSMQAWLRRHCRLSPGAARERLLVARRLNDELPETTSALEAGDISYSHARAIATATTDLRRGRVREIEPILVDVAREHDPTELSRAVAVWREAADARPRSTSRTTTTWPAASTSLRLSRTVGASMASSTPKAVRHSRPHWTHT